MALFRRFYAETGSRKSGAITGSSDVTGNTSNDAVFIGVDEDDPHMADWGALFHQMGELKLAEDAYLNALRRGRDENTEENLRRLYKKMRGEIRRR